MQLNWGKCEGSAGDVWCSLADINLDHPYFDNLEGVYVIWRDVEGANCVRVGQGYIRERLRVHRTDPKVQAYAAGRRLLVTWAAVPAAYRDGVEAYLAQQLSPAVGVRFPGAAPIAVNLPA